MRCHNRRLLIDKRRQRFETYLSGRKLAPWHATWGESNPSPPHRRCHQTRGGVAQHLHARQWPAVPGRNRIAGELTKFQPIWVDLNPPPRRKRWIKQHYGLSIPEDAMDDDIEESARFYEEDNGELHIRSDFLIDDDEDPARCAWPSS